MQFNFMYSCILHQSTDNTDSNFKITVSGIVFTTHKAISNFGLCHKVLTLKPALLQHQYIINFSIHVVGLPHDSLQLADTSLTNSLQGRCLTSPFNNFVPCLIHNFTQSLSIYNIQRQFVLCIYDLQSSAVWGKLYQLTA